MPYVYDTPIADKTDASNPHTSLQMSESPRQRSEIELLYQTSRSIATAAEVDDVVTAYLNQVALNDRYACNVVVYNRNSDGSIRSRTARGVWFPGKGVVLSRTEDPYIRDLLDDVLDKGETIVVPDVRKHRLVPEFLREHQVTIGRLALAMIPLLASQRRLGVVVLSHPGPYEWRAEDLWPYQTTAAVLSLALESRIASEQAREQARFVAVLEERNRLARELHDSVTQMLFSLQLLAESTPEVFSADQAEGVKRLDRIIDLSGRALGEMRRLLNELRPEHAKSSTIGFRERLLAIESDYRAHGLEVVSQVGTGLDLTESSEHELVRILEEAASNALRHSRCTSLQVQLGGDPPILEICDNGVGFDSSNPTGMGLMTMAQRSEVLGARFSLATGPTGTKIRVELPKSAESDPPDRRR